MSVNYVRFQRGSQEAYDALKAAGQLDNNTLYFIYHADNSSVGALYMGNRIISGGDITIASARLDDLADVIVAGAGTDSFLVKGENDNWVAKSLDEVIALIQDNIGDVTAAPAQVFQATLEADETDLEAIERAVGVNIPVAGDIAIIKALIADDRYQHTAYVYDGENWAAMDGNYNAETVYFDSNLTITADIGVQTVPSSGSLELVTAGKNLKQVLDMILAARKTPTRTLPRVTVTSDEDISYEVGTTVAPSYSASLSAGSYTYGPATGIAAESWSVTFNGETLTTNTGTFNSFVVDDSTNLRIAATANYGEGAVPVDNLGEELTDATELANCQIQEGSAVGYSNYIKGFRNIFHGSKVDAIELNSNNIRGLSANVSTSGTVSVTINEGSRQVIIATPSGRVVTKVADEGAFGTDIFSEFVKSTVSVGGADATADSVGNNAKDYNVYVYSPSTALGANTYTVTIANG